MENWDELVERKKEEIENDYVEDIKKATNAAEIKRAMDKVNRRLEKVDALSVVERATQMMLKCMEIMEGQ